MPPKVTAATRAGRAAQRRRDGPLRQKRLQPATQKRYLVAARWFLWWLHIYSLPYSDSVQELGSQLSSFIEYLYESGEHRGLAGDVISGSQWILSAKRVFIQAWSVHKAWGERELPRRAPPLPIGILLAMAGTALYCRDLSTAVLLLIGCSGYLRTGELLSIIVSACNFDWTNMILVIALPVTKSGLRSGAQEMVAIQDERTMRLCAHLCSKLVQ